MKQAITLTTINSEPRVSSIDLALHLEIEYKALNNLINNYKTDLEYFGELHFKKDVQSRKTPAFLTQDQAIFAITLSRNSKQVVECKKAIVKAFSVLRKKQAAIDTNHAKVEYQLMREGGKDTRAILSEKIEKLNIYAEAAGSKNPKRQTTITLAIYKSFLISKLKASKIRDLLSPIQLSQLQTIELIIAELISTELAKETHYSDIYPLIKKKLSELEIPKSKILPDDIDRG